MEAKSESGLRRKLNRLGYRLSKRDGMFMITDLEHGGAVHAIDVFPHCLDIADVQWWAKELS